MDHEEVTRKSSSCSSFRAKVYVGSQGEKKTLCIGSFHNKADASDATREANLAIHAPCVVCGRRECGDLSNVLNGKRKRFSKKNEDVGHSREGMAIRNTPQQTRAIAIALSELAMQRTFDARKFDIVGSKSPRTLMLAAMVAEEWAKILQQQGVDNDCT